MISFRKQPSFIMASLLLILLVLAAPAPSAAITCSNVLTDLKPCLSYLQNGKGAPPSACCAGAKSLVASATSTADKKTACSCLKSASSSMTVNAEAAKSLPKSCGISLSFDISKDVDCSKIT